MSADLWSAFATEQQDGLENPWALPIPNTGFHVNHTKAGAKERIDNSLKINPRSAFEAASTARPTNAPRFGQSTMQPGWESKKGSAGVDAATAARDTNIGPLETNLQHPGPEISLVHLNDAEFGEFEEPEADKVKDTSALTEPSKWVPSTATFDDDEFGDYEGPGADFTPRIAVRTPVEVKSISQPRVLDVDEVLWEADIPSFTHSDSTRCGGHISQRIPNPNVKPDLSGPQKSISASLKSKSSNPNAVNQASHNINGPCFFDEWDDFPPDIEVSAQISTQDARRGRKSPAQVKLHGASRPSTISATKNEGQTVCLSSAKPKDALPPSNVPPPSILISLASGLVQKLQARVETMCMGPEANKSALRQAIASLRVTARILAGRKLRWKRDTNLAQSMRIAPAGKPGGMKLTGVDKAEVRREDREAAELVCVWKQNIGSIRATLATVNAHLKTEPEPLPEISGEPTVRMLKEVNGGVIAVKACVLCGIKREERVDKVDREVRDEFGEWWTEHWGHAECRVWWEEHQGDLKQR